MSLIKPSCIKYLTLNIGFTLQSQIGWDMIFRGLFTAKWEVVATSLKSKGKWIETTSLILANLERDVGSLQ
jgi:hypothetical protein